MRRRMLRILLSTVLTTALLAGFSPQVMASAADSPESLTTESISEAEETQSIPGAEEAMISDASGISGAETPADAIDIQILATSDLHGKFMPWDYAQNVEDTSGSVAQLASAIKEYRTDNTLLVDAGDTIQDNSADIFLSEDIHPMILAMNALGYDIWVTGNHEYNYGMDIVEKTIASQEADVLVGNVYDENGDPLAKGYTIVERDGVKIGVLGMVTPNITRWDGPNLKGYTVTDPAEECRKIIDEIEDETDLLIGVMHMGTENEYNVPNSGVTDLANACPEFDLIVASHEHRQIPGEEINGVLVVENNSMAQTMAVAHLILEKTDSGYELVDRTSESVEIADYAPDEELAELLTPYDEAAKADAEVVIGKLEGGDLAPESEVEGIPTAQIEDTALIDLINTVQMHYTEADVSASALFTMNANLMEGDIKKSDTSLIYKYQNTLYKLAMNGAQLKKYMEWSARYYNQYQPGDLLISFNEDIRAYNYDMFAGVNYEIDISQPEGSRIVNLTWPDGTPVEDDDQFTIAVNNYRASTQLLSPGEVFEEDEIPELLEIDVRGDLGGVREIIRDYIVNVKVGTITPECDHNWKIVGNDWDESLHEKAVELLASGEISLVSSEDGRTPNVKSITEDDLP